MSVVVSRANLPILDDPTL